MQQPDFITPGTGCQCARCTGKTAQWTVPPPGAAEAVNHPAHYQAGGIECIDVIEQLGLGFHLGNALKYIWRCDRKQGTGTVEDCEKALWYLKREIALRKKGPNA